MNWVSIRDRPDIACNLRLPISSVISDRTVFRNEASGFGIAIELWLPIRGGSAGCGRKRVGRVLGNKRQSAPFLAAR